MCQSLDAADLRMRLDQSVDRETSLEKQVEDLQSSNTQYEAELERVTTTLADTSTKLSETESSLENVRTELRDCQETLAQSTEQSVCLLGELKTNNIQLVTKSVEETLRSRITALRVELDQALVHQRCHAVSLHRTCKCSECERYRNQRSQFTHCGFARSAAATAELDRE